MYWNKRKEPKAANKMNVHEFNCKYKIQVTKQMMTNALHKNASFD